ncbi:MAG: hypothetical protein ACOYWZ_00135 [Bacillota bacterium]
MKIATEIEIATPATPAKSVKIEQFFRKMKRNDIISEKPSENFHCWNSRQTKKKIKYGKRFCLCLFPGKDSNRDRDSKVELIHVEKYLKSILNYELAKNNLTAIEICDIEEKLTVLLDEAKKTQEWAKVIIALAAIEREKGISLSNVKDYFLVISAEVVSEEEKETVVEGEELLVRAFLEKMNFGKKQMIKLDKQISYETCKKLMRKIMRMKYDEGNNIEKANDIVYPFVISENHESKGNVLFKKTPYPENITLISVRLTDDDIIPKFIGELNFREILQSPYFYAESFFLYQYETDGKTKMLLSKNEIRSGRISLKGMEIYITDCIRTGTSASVPAKSSIIIATEITPELRVIQTEKECMDVIEEKQLDHEKLAQALLGNLRHPKKFEKLLLTWLFHYPVSGYPFHIFWIAEPGTGKSFALDSIIKYAMKEPQGVAAVDMSTMKSLVPSYGQTNFEMGYMLRCQRVGGIDELFKKMKIEHEDATGWFPSILECKERIVGSGKHSGIIVKPTARFIIATNPKYKLGNIYEMHEKLDHAFLSRLLFYRQTRQHIQFVKENQPIIRSMSEKQWFPKGENWLIEITDYLHSYHLPCSFPLQRIIEKYKALLPWEISEHIYEPRIDHHLACIIDGVAKYNSIIEKREKLCVTEKDMSDAEELLGMCIVSMLENDEESVAKLSHADRIHFLSLSQLKLYDKIKAAPGLIVSELECELSEPVKQNLVVLEEFLLIKKEENNGQMHYYVTDIFDEIDKKKTYP